MIPDRAPAATSAAPSVLVERARAKINLTLRILGRRPDGYHELESLVAFADVADELTLDLDAPPGLTVTGSFAADLQGHANLVQRAVDLALATDPHLAIGHLTLAKHLPVAAGIGGGSADAAAALRLLRAANPERAASIDWLALAARLGADVPVCFVDRMALIRGIGTIVEPVTTPGEPMAALLVNPLVAVPADKTAAVFRALAAPMLTEQASAPVPVSLAAIAAATNDLQAAAIRVMPVIAEVLAALGRLPGVRFARLSGAGPTCLAMFSSADKAAEARDTLQRHHPNWWITATALG